MQQARSWRLSRIVPGVGVQGRGRLIDLARARPPTMSAPPLLPYEWPGSYFVGNEELENVTKAVVSRSPYRYYGADLQHFCDKVEEAYCARLNREHATLVNSGTGALSVAFAA